jgi:Zn-finger nucleic acid-binding protein
MKCLKCSKEMDVIEISGSTGLEVDVCQEHGVWLDGGELSRLVTIDSSKKMHKQRVVKKKLKQFAVKLSVEMSDKEFRVKKKRAKQIKDL